jgi:hypothetical protein
MVEINETFSLSMHACMPHDLTLDPICLHLRSKLGYWIRLLYACMTAHNFSSKRYTALLTSYSQKIVTMHYNAQLSAGDICHPPAAGELDVEAYDDDDTVMSYLLVSGFGIL